MFEITVCELSFVNLVSPKRIGYKPAGAQKGF